MERAKREVEDYLEEVQEYKQCLLRNMEEANSDAENIVDEWNTSIKRYNSR
jgi:vacuolar-type H+-ATPase subunit H